MAKAPSTCESAILVFADKGQRVQYTADVAEYDLLDASAVMSIGTDFTLKCSWGFFDTAKGTAQISSPP